MQDKTNTEKAHEKLIESGEISSETPVIYGSEIFFEKKDFRKSVKASVNPDQDLDLQKDILFCRTWYKIPEDMRDFDVIVSDPGFGVNLTGYPHHLNHNWSDLFECMRGKIYVNYKNATDTLHDLHFVKKKYGFEIRLITDWIWVLSKKLEKKKTIDIMRLKYLYDLFRVCGLQKYDDQKPKENNIKYVLDNLLRTGGRWEDLFDRSSKYKVQELFDKYVCINENWIPEENFSADAYKELHKLVLIKNLCKL